MRIDEAGGAAQAAAVDEAGVVLGVGEDRVALVHQRGDDARIRGEAGGKDERRLGAFELGEPSFQFCVARRPAAHQRTRPAAPPFPIDRLPWPRPPSRGSAARPR